MNWVKKFESFDSDQSYKDLLEDIKTIDYIIDEYGYIISYGYGIDMNKNIINLIVYIELPLHTKTKHLLKEKGITLKEYGDKFQNDCNSYMKLLLEHLDYIDKDKVVVDNGNAYYKIKIVI